MSIQVLEQFSASELETALKLAKAAEIQFFHLRGCDGLLAFCDLSIDRSRLLKIVFPKPTSLGWGDVKGIIDIKYAYRDLRRYIRGNGGEKTSIIYGEFDDGGLSFGYLGLQDGGLWSEIYREGGSYRYGYHAGYTENWLRELPNINLENHLQKPRGTFRIGLKRFNSVLTSLEGDLVLIQQAEEGEVVFQQVIRIDGPNDYTPKYGLGRKAPLQAASDKRFSVLFSMERLLTFTRALEKVAPSSVVDVSINSSGLLEIGAETRVGSVTFVLARYNATGITASFDGYPIDAL